MPAFVRWPGKFPAGVTLNGIVGHEDWLPTFAAAAGDAGIKEKLRRRFAAAARLVGRLGRDVDHLKPHPNPGEFAGQIRVDLLHVGHREVTAAHTRLVGHHEQVKSGVLQPLQRR